MTVPTCVPAPTPPGEAGRRLSFHLVRVECKDETEHERVGPVQGEGLANDAIRLFTLNTIQIGADAAVQCATPVFNAGDNYEDGRWLDFDHELASAWLPAGTTFPVKVNCLVTLGEEDWGGQDWDTSTKTIIEKAGPVIREQVVKMTSTAIGSAIGSAAGPLGSLAGAAVGYIAGALVDELAAAAKTLNSDFFTPVDATLIIENAAAPLSETDPSRLQQVLTYEGFGGLYELTCEWRSYVQQPAPSQPSEPTIDHLDFVLTTGDDDLRGGNDNVNLLVELADGRTLRLDEANQRQRWEDRSVHTVRFVLPTGVVTHHIKAVVLETTSRGGIGGDNWNLDAIEVRSTMGPLLNARSGRPFFRFTGDQGRLRISVP